jgi:hypothetical protein
MPGSCFLASDKTAAAEDNRLLWLLSLAFFWQLRFFSAGSLEAKRSWGRKANLTEDNLIAMQAEGEGEGCEWRRLPFAAHNGKGPALCLAGIKLWKKKMGQK